MEPECLAREIWRQFAWPLTGAADGGCSADGSCCCMEPECLARESWRQFAWPLTGAAECQPTDEWCAQGGGCSWAAGERNPDACRMESEREHEEGSTGKCSHTECF